MLKFYHWRRVRRDRITPVNKINDPVITAGQERRRNTTKTTEVKTSCNLNTDNFWLITSSLVIDVINNITRRTIKEIQFKIFIYIRHILYANVRHIKMQIYYRTRKLYPLKMVPHHHPPPLHCSHWFSSHSSSVRIELKKNRGFAPSQIGMIQFITNHHSEAISNVRSRTIK